VSAEAVALTAIAVATGVMALIQVGAIIYAARLARRVEALVERLERDVQPLLERLTALGTDAARAAGLAAGQVERADRLLTELGRRLDHTIAGVQRSIARPAREGAALVAAVRAAVLTLRDMRQRRRRANSHGSDDEDPLFIG
jgi:hypothetical protein